MVVVQHDSLRVDELVVGNGPTAVLAAALLARPARSQLLISANPFGMLDPICLRVNRDRWQLINVPPVFPPENDTLLSRRLNRILPDAAAFAGAPVSIRTASSEAVIDESNVLATLPREQSVTIPFSSYAACRGVETLILSEKQYGDVIWTQPLEQVRTKIERAYSAGFSLGTSRIGYHKGLSPYYRLMSRLLPGIQWARTRIQSVDVSARSCLLANGVTVHYGKMVFAGKLEELCRVLNRQCVRIVSAPARFIVGTFTVTASYNSVTYDPRPESPIFRLSIPAPGTWVAQIGQGTRGSDSNDDSGAGDSCLPTRVVPWVESLAGWKVQRTVNKIVTFAQAYPLEAMQEDDRSSLDAACRAAGIVRFGRQAEWRYVDLHELDWSALCGIN